MNVDRAKLKALMQERCNGNYNKFARDLGIDASHLYRYLNSGIGGGRKLIGAVMKYCIVNGINYEDYIEL